MDERQITVIGLPGSGKTTYLAALWSLITEGTAATALKLHSLKAGDSSHLNKIARRWRSAVDQDRTLLLGNQTVIMNLIDVDGRKAQIRFPDLAGEDIRRMWESRLCDAELIQHLSSRSVLLFIHSDTIKYPMPITEKVRIEKALGQEANQSEATEPVEWAPGMAPTQIQIIGLLELLASEPLDIGPRKLAVVLSAWDKVRPQTSTPMGVLDMRLPMLAQFLRQNFHGWKWEVYGISAQGGAYDPADKTKPRSKEAERLREYEMPSQRIKVVTEGGANDNDLTLPLSWLME